MAHMCPLNSASSYERGILGAAATAVLPPPPPPFAPPPQGLTMSLCLARTLLYKPRWSQTLKVPLGLWTAGVEDEHPYTWPRNPWFTACSPVVCSVYKNIHHGGDFSVTFPCSSYSHLFRVDSSRVRFWGDILSP